MTNGARLQAEYYRSTAAHYDEMHLADDDEHGVALRYVSALVREFELRSVLDVGTGTGRALAALVRAHPDLLTLGVEPILALLTRTRADVRRAAHLASASGYSLPFADASFDAVSAFGVFHHVEHPTSMLREMLRVARRAVFVSDSNRFGQGRPAVRVGKFVLAKLGLWPVANYLKTGGAGYMLSDGDGLSYSYSVYDSLELLQDWADRVVLIPTGRGSVAGWSSPLLTSSHVLACALRDR